MDRPSSLFSCAVPLHAGLDLPWSDGMVTLVFVRVPIKLAGLDDGLLSRVQHLELQLTASACPSHEVFGP